MLLPVGLTIYGLVTLNKAVHGHFTATDLALLAVEIVVALVAGLARGATIKLYVRDGHLWQRYSVMNLLVWIGLIAVRIGSAGLGHGIGANLPESGTLMATFGVSILVESLVVARGPPRPAPRSSRPSRAGATFAAARSPLRPPDRCPLTSPRRPAGARPAGGREPARPPDRNPAGRNPASRRTRPGPGRRRVRMPAGGGTGPGPRPDSAAGRNPAGPDTDRPARPRAARSDNAQPARRRAAQPDSARSDAARTDRRSRAAGLPVEVDRGQGSALAGRPVTRPHPADWSTWARWSGWDPGGSAPVGGYAV